MTGDPARGGGTGDNDLPRGWNHDMKTRKLTRRIWLTAAALSAGTLPSNCQTIVRDSFTTATRQTVANFLDPSNFDFEALIRDLLGADSD